MLWIYLTIFAILDIYCLVYFHQMNKGLREEITVTKTWCKNMIEDLVEQERKLDELLLQVIKDINSNKVSSDVIEILNSENMCEYHMQVYNDMKDEQTRITNKIMDIQNEHSNMIKDIKDKFEEIPGD